MDVEKVIFSMVRIKFRIHLHHTWGFLDSFNYLHFNFVFPAIQFVLANEFDHIPTEQLTGMIHHSEKAAYVEIEFNNDDERLPVS